MNKPLWLFRFDSLTLMSVLILNAVDSSEKLRNDKVVAFESTVAQGQHEPLPADRPSVIVYMQPGMVAITDSVEKSETLTVKPGQSIFEPAGAGKIQNVGSSDLRLVRIDFLGKGNPERWGNTGLSPHYKVLLDNAYARVYDIYIPAHTNEPQHTHKDRIVICLSGAELTHHFPDGRTEVSSLKTGDIVWRRGRTHVGENHGTSDFRAIAIEPK